MNMKDITIDESEEFLDMTQVKDNGPYAYFKRYGKNDVLMRVHFNRKATVLFAGKERQYAVKVSRRYVVFLPTTLGRRLSIARSGTGAISVQPLIGMVAEGMKFRVYPYKGGVAIDTEEVVG